MSVKSHYHQLASECRKDNPLDPSDQEQKNLKTSSVEYKLMEALTASSCNVCGKTSSLICSGCKDAVYCTDEHQRQHWEEHRKVCFPSDQLNTLEVINTYESSGEIHDREGGGEAEANAETINLDKEEIEDEEYNEEEEGGGEEGGKLEMEVKVDDCKTNTN